MKRKNENLDDNEKKKKMHKKNHFFKKPDFLELSKKYESFAPL
jgi:hypothetical protein